MIEYFPAPPRPRGRAWWSRCAEAAIWCCMGAVAGAFALGSLAVVALGQHGPELEPAAVLLLFVAVFGAFAAITARGAWRCFKEMRLLRRGIELLARRQGRRATVAHGDRVRTVPLPVYWSQLAYVTPGRPEIVVLASRDLSSIFFPRVSDLPLEGVVVGDGEPQLPATLRPGPGAWRDGTNRHYREWTRGVAVLALIVAAATLLAVGPLTSLAVLGAFALWYGLLFLAWKRAILRDLVLWREGEEIHAVLLDERQALAGRKFEVAFSRRDRAVRRTFTMRTLFRPLKVQPPPDATVLTPRLVLLVDPLRPARCALLPESAGSIR